MDISDLQFISKISGIVGCFPVQHTGLGVIVGSCDRVEMLYYTICIPQCGIIHQFILECAYKAFDHGAFSSRSREIVSQTRGHSEKVLDLVVGELYTTVGPYLDTSKTTQPWCDISPPLPKASQNFVASDFFKRPGVDKF